MSSLPSPERTRIALLGCGRIARRIHLPILQRNDTVELAAIAELDEDFHTWCRRALPRTPVFSDYRELLKSSSLDAVVICLPTDLHAEAALACLERGLHVYVEKPLASTLADAEAMVAARARAGTVGAVGFNLRFHPLVARLREELRAGTLGKPVAVHTVFGAARRELPAWKLRRASGGGALLDLASHHVDLLRFLFDSEIVEVRALLRGVETEDDTAVLAMRLASGPLVTTLVSIAAVEEDRFAVYGTRGGLVFDRYRSVRLTFVPPDRPSTLAQRMRARLDALPGKTADLRAALRPRRESSFALALASFAAAVRGSEWTGADFDDGLRSLAVVVAAEEAAAAGDAVTMAAAR